MAPGEYVEFDAVVHGWRIAPGQVLEEEFGTNDIRNLDLDCDPKNVSDATKTNLDIKVNYVPAGWTLKENPNVDKWVCDDIGLSTFYQYGLEKPGQGGAGIRLDRVLEGRRAFALSAPADGVTACTIRDLPAICVRHGVPSPSFTFIVIEDDTLDPFVSHLLLEADGPIPYDELVKMLEALD